MDSFDRHRFRRNDVAVADGCDMYFGYCWDSRASCSIFEPGPEQQTKTVTPLSRLKHDFDITNDNPMEDCLKPETLTVLATTSPTKAGLKRRSISRHHGNGKSTRWLMSKAKKCSFSMPPNKKLAPGLLIKSRCLAVIRLTTVILVAF